MDPWGLILLVLGWGSLAIVLLLVLLVLVVLVVLVQGIVGAFRSKGSSYKGRSMRTDVENSHTIFRSGDRE